MQFNNLKRNSANRKARQVGRGSKRGKTAGRGTKGQNARSGRKKRPEMRDFIKKLPKLRGRGKNYLKTRVTKPVVIQASVIEKNFKAGEVITVASLLEKKLLSKKDGKVPQVKVLGSKNIATNFKFEGVGVSGSPKK